MLTVNPESFEKIFSLVQELEKRTPLAGTTPAAVSEKERLQAFERLMKYPRKKLPSGFNYKKRKGHY